MDAPEQGIAVVIVTRRGASPTRSRRRHSGDTCPLTPQATSRIEWSHRCGGAVDELLTARSGHTTRVALLVAYDASVVAGQQVPRRPPVGTPGRSWTMQMWPIAHGDPHRDVIGCGDPHHPRCARVRAAISDVSRARSLIWDIACSRSAPFRRRRYRRKVCLNWRVPF